MALFLGDGFDVSGDDRAWLCVVVFEFWYLIPAKRTMLNTANLSTYLQLLLIKEPELSLASLKELQTGHLANFCFSSLGVLLKDDLSLEPEQLFDRVVTRNRGGYCFEHNKILFEVLRSLGFDCEIVLARVLLNRDIDVPRTHRITRLTLDGTEYIVDVGFGALCPREPLQLHSEHPQDQGDAVYRIIQPVPNHYFLQIEDAEAAGGWFTLYRFDIGYYTEADCLCGHHYSSTYPKAVFVNNLVMAVKSYDDIRSLVNGEFHRIRGGQKEVILISSAEMLAEIIAQEFGIELPGEQAAGLYQNYCV